VYTFAVAFSGASALGGFQEIPRPAGIQVRSGREPRLLACSVGFRKLAGLGAVALRQSWTPRGAGFPPLLRVPSELQRPLERGDGPGADALPSHVFERFAQGLLGAMGSQARPAEAGSVNPLQLQLPAGFG
jgi:hypothetical protein